MTIAATPQLALGQNRFSLVHQLKEQLSNLESRRISTISQISETPKSL